MKKIGKYLEIRIILIAVLMFLLGWQMGHRDVSIRWESFKPSVSIENKVPPKSINLDFKLFWDTWDLISSEYFDKKAVDPQKLFYGAISGMVAAVGDPYTFFLPPEQQKATSEELNGSFDGVGIQLGFNKDKRLVVIAPLSGSPAQNAGIKPQDIIVKIDDKDTTNFSLPEAVNLIRGTKGTKVTLGIIRAGLDSPKAFTLTRDTIIVKSVEVSYKQTNSGKSVAVIKLSRFGERTQTEWETAVGEILSKNTQEVVLDMRNNPGGFLEGAVFIASEFLTDGDVVLQENAAGQRSGFGVNRVGKLTKIPVIVLINKGSASASEIVAGALHDRGRAKLVGEQSFGKGTIQEAKELEGSTGIHITVAKWLTPNGHWVNETNGLEPDIKVDAPKVGDSEDVTADPQLDKAIELLE